MEKMKNATGVVWGSLFVCVCFLFFAKSTDSEENKGYYPWMYTNMITIVYFLCSFIGIHVKNRWKNICFLQWLLQMNPICVAVEKQACTCSPPPNIQIHMFFIDFSVKTGAYFFCCVFLFSQTSTPSLSLLSLSIDLLIPTSPFFWKTIQNTNTLNWIGSELIVWVDSVFPFQTKTNITSIFLWWLWKIHFWVAVSVLRPSVMMLFQRCSLVGI